MDKCPRPSSEANVEHSTLNSEAKFGRFDVLCSMSDVQSSVFDAYHRFPKVRTSSTQKIAAGIG